MATDSSKPALLESGLEMARGEDLIRIPRGMLSTLESYLMRAVRRMQQTPGMELQELSVEGEDVLLNLCALWARDDTRAALWGAGGRPTMPPPARANGGER